MVNWRDTKTDPPDEGQECLTQMKHGLISGCYDFEKKTFHGYYWHDMEWFAAKWVPVEELK